MKRFSVWIGVSLIVTTTLVFASCSAPAAISPKSTQATHPAQATASTAGATTTPATAAPAMQAPNYGGTFVFGTTTDVNSFDFLTQPPGGGITKDYTNERVWDGDWTKGPAGGYGTNQTTWGGVTNIDALKTGYLADKITWAMDPGTENVTTSIEVRQGVHYALDPNSEASKLVNGRELTADDIVYNLNIRMNDPRSWTLALHPELKGVQAIKTGPWEVQFTLPASDYMIVRMIILDGGLIFPPEVQEKYGSFSNWQNAVGTGPYMLTDYVAGSEATLTRNPNYWMKNPIGPGKGNQLPYTDSIDWLIIPDTSTLYAALRTAKIDWVTGVQLDDAEQLMKTQGLQNKAENPMTIGPIEMRTDQPPFSDIRVRQALMMATDFNAINDGLYQGKAQTLTWPYYLQSGYQDLYLGLNDPEMPASVKELYTYNPDQAKRLLSQAGYPNGFTVPITLYDQTTPEDYISVVKSQWAKVGINLTLQPKDFGVLENIMNRRDYTGLILGAQPPPASWPEAAYAEGDSQSNLSMVNDPTFDAAVAKWSVLAITNETAAMEMTKEEMKYVLAQAWAIPGPCVPVYSFWWPWIKNYSGEVMVGWMNSDWARWCWLDQNLKKSMGH